MGALILFALKQDKIIKLYVDYCSLNKMTIKNCYLLPLVNEMLDWLFKAKNFTKLDLQNAYYRLHIKEGDEWKIAFKTQYSHFEYCVLPFGLTNTPVTFQLYIHKALRGLVDNTYIVYLDDILIYLKKKIRINTNSIFMKCLNN